MFQTMNSNSPYKRLAFARVCFQTEFMLSNNQLHLYILCYPPKSEAQYKQNNSGTPLASCNHFFRICHTLCRHSALFLSFLAVSFLFFFGYFLHCEDAFACDLWIMFTSKRKKEQICMKIEWRIKPDNNVKMEMTENCCMQSGYFILFWKC